jgi:UDP-glucose 4-epimerase
VYGVGQNMGNLKQGMASIYLAMALKDNHITVKGAKDRFRDFVYIDDVVDAVIKALDRTNGELYEFYNVSTGQKQTVEEVINVITNELNTGVTVEYVEGTPGDQHGIFGNNEKIKNDLSWTSKYDFKSGMKKMIEWAVSSKKNRG